MRKILIYIFLLISASNGTAQNHLTGTSDLKKLKDWQVKGMARSAMRMNDVYLARDFLDEWHQRQPQNIKILVQLAYYHLKARDYEKAQVIFKKISTDYPDQYPDARFYYAQLLKIETRYEEALDVLQVLRRRYRKLTGTGITRSRIDNEIIGCQIGIASRDSMVKTEVFRFDETINTPHIEFGPLLLGESTFVYGSTKLDSTVLISTEQPFNASRHFYEARKHEDIWSGGYETSAPFYNFDNYDTGRGAFSADRKRFYSVHCTMNPKGRNICHIYMSHLEGDSWSTPQKLDKSVNHPRYNSTHPTVGTCFSPSLEVLYFVSDRKGGAGGYDIWYSVYDKKTGRHNKAENAGVFINTPQDEITPYFDLPSHRLYFSSNGWPTIGGFDVFYAKGDMATWEPSVNVRRPVNSSYDDLNFVQNHSGKFGLFASNRPGSLSFHHQSCCDDLYAFHETESPRVLVTGRLVKEDIIKESGLFRTEEPDHHKAIVEPVVISNRTVMVQMVKDSLSSVLLQEIQTNSKGEFEIWVDPGMDFQLTVNDPGLINNQFAFSTKNVEKDQLIDVSTIALTTITEKAVVIDNIYYQFNQTDLSAEAKTILDSTLVLLMQRYPAIKVEIASHTDNVGDEKYNQRLSERRALGVMQYLVSKGISKSRLTAKGYGESLPLAPNQHEDGSDNPKGREINRRTEFKITGLTDNMLKFRDNN